jgi:hypothetical protein
MRKYTQHSSSGKEIRGEQRMRMEFRGCVNQSIIPIYQGIPKEILSFRVISKHYQYITHIIPHYNKDKRKMTLNQNPSQD